MRDLTEKELNIVSGGTDNGYGAMPNPPNFSDFSSAVGQGALFGLYVGGPVGALEGAFGGGAVYITVNAWNNFTNYYY